MPRLFDIFTPSFNTIPCVVGCYKFICRLVDRKNRVIKTTSIPKIDTQSLSKDSKHARLKVYEALQKQQNIFNKKIDGYPFNVVIAACMEAHNALLAQDNDMVFTEGYFILLHILENFIPHIASELSEELFQLSNFTPINIDTSAFKQDEIIYVVSVNGKKRSEVTINVNASKEEILKEAKNAVEKWLTSDIKKEILVPNKLVNFVL